MGRCLSRQRHPKQRITVRYRPVAHSGLVACALFAPAVQAVLGVERSTVNRRVGHLQVPALNIRGRRHRKAHPQCLPGGEGVNRVRFSTFPRNGRGACHLIRRKLACGVNPVVTPVRQPHELTAVVQIQHGAWLFSRRGCHCKAEQSGGQQRPTMCLSTSQDVL